MNSGMLIERTINAAIVLLVGAIQYAIPALTRPDLFFAVTVRSRSVLSSSGTVSAS